MFLICLILSGQSHILIDYENSFNEIWLAAGGGVSADLDHCDGRLLLGCAPVFASGVRVSDDDADGLATGSDSADRSDLGVFVFSRPGQNHCPGCDAAAESGGRKDRRG